MNYSIKIVFKNLSTRLPLQNIIKRNESPVQRRCYGIEDNIVKREDPLSDPPIQ
jgi:hypothetical protein